jgi:hypothetical protein
MWTQITRARYDRSGLRDASHLTDPEWALIPPELRVRASALAGVALA